MDQSKLIIEQSYVEEKEYTEEELIRMGYVKAAPEDWVDDTFTVNKFELSEMRVDSEKEKKNGGTYYSSKCILVCYNDEHEIQMPFFIENFKMYNDETDTLVVKGKNVLAKLIPKIKPDEVEGDNNRFKLKFETLREIINETSDIPITIVEYVKYGGYKDYTIE